MGIFNLWNESRQRGWEKIKQSFKDYKTEVKDKLYTTPLDFFKSPIQSLKPSKSTGNSALAGFLELVFNDSHWYQPSDSRNVTVLNTNYPKGVYDGDGLRGTDAYLAGAIYRSDSSPTNFGTPMANLVRVTLADTVPYNALSGDITAIDKLYTILRAANAGATNYDSQTLYNYVLAVNQGHILYHVLLKLLRCAHTSNSSDTSMPDSLIACCGFDPSEIPERIAELSLYLENFARFLNNQMPYTCSLNARKAFLYGNLFLDNCTELSTLINIMPANLLYPYKTLQDGTYQWELETELFPATINPAYKTNVAGGVTNNTYASIDGLINVINQYMERMRSTYEYSVIAGDLRKAFGLGYSANVPVLTIDEIPPMLAAYSDDIHNQLKAATWDANPNDYINIGPNGTIYFRPSATVQMDNRNSDFFNDTTHFFNVESEVANDPGRAAEATRLISTVSENPGECLWSTEVLRRVTIGYVRNSAYVPPLNSISYPNNIVWIEAGALIQMQDFAATGSSYNEYTNEDWENILKRAVLPALIMQIDCMPSVYYQTKFGGQNVFSAVAQKIEAFAGVSLSTIRGINSKAAYALFEERSAQFKGSEGRVQKSQGGNKNSTSNKKKNKNKNKNNQNKEEPKKDTTKEQQNK